MNLRRALINESVPCLFETSKGMVLDSTQVNKTPYLLPSFFLVLKAVGQKNQRRNLWKVMRVQGDLLGGPPSSVLEIYFWAFCKWLICKGDSERRTSLQLSRSHLNEFHLKSDHALGADLLMKVLDHEVIYMICPWQNGWELDITGQFRSSMATANMQDTIKINKWVKFGRQVIFCHTGRQWCSSYGCCQHGCGVERKPPV